MCVDFFYCTKYRIEQFEVLPSIFIAHKVQQPHCSSNFISSVANSRSRAFRKSICAQEKVATNLYRVPGMHWGGSELTKLTYTRLEDNLVRHRGDRRWMNTGRRLPLELQCSLYVTLFFHELAVCHAASSDVRIAVRTAQSLSHCCCCVYRRRNAYKTPQQCDYEYV